MIEIVHSATGEFKQFADAQAVADFLQSWEDAKDWTGFEFLGKLPAPTVTAAQAPEAPAEPQSGEPVPAAPEAQVPAEPAAESLLERIEHAVEDIIHGDAPAADPS